LNESVIDFFINGLTTIQEIYFNIFFYSTIICPILFVVFLVFFIISIVKYRKNRVDDPSSKKYLPRILGFLFAMLLNPIIIGVTAYLFGIA